MYLVPRTFKNNSEVPIQRSESLSTSPVLQGDSIRKHCAVFETLSSLLDSHLLATESEGNVTRFTATVASCVCFALLIDESNNDKRK